MRNSNTLITTFVLMLFFCNRSDTSAVHAPDITVIVSDRYDIEMVLIPSGTAQIGATLDYAVEKCESLRMVVDTTGVGGCRRTLTSTVPDGESFFVTPADEVFLEDYFIDRYEVSIEAYEECVDDSGCNPEVLQYVRELSPSVNLGEPIRNISYLDAEAYCAWRGGYIPSEAEWEYASRGPQGFAFPWGEEFDGSIVNFCDANCEVQALRSEMWNDGFASVAPVTAHPEDSSWAGAANFAGNVSEWTSTIYISRTMTLDVGEEMRVVKGGNYWSSPDQSFLWRRFPFLEDQISEGIGFRCAKRL